MQVMLIILMQIMLMLQMPLILLIMQMLSMMPKLVKPVYERGYQHE